MKDRIEATLENLKSAWGALVMQPADMVVERMKTAISASTEDRNVRTAIFSLFMRGLDEQNINQESFLGYDDVSAILLPHIESGVLLYFLQKLFSTINRDIDRDPMDEKTFYDTYAVGISKVLDADFDVAVNRAHAELDELIDNGPNHMTNCEVKIWIVDNGSLIPMGSWLWDRKSEKTFWDQPERH